MNNIKLHSRDNCNNWLEPISFILKSELGHIRAGMQDDEIAFVDPLGGPFITKGGKIEELGDKVVESIVQVPDKGFVITVV